MDMIDWRYWNDISMQSILECDGHDTLPNTLNY